jgi:hypothetical protein
MADNFYTPLTDEEYYERFGVTNGEVTDEAKLKEAYERACKLRDFEITTLWTRVTYFWGFIAAIFAGYIALMTREHEVIDTHLSLYLILLGIIFSVAWLLVIKGSKCWQNNWEFHIDMLEKYIVGPLYKTVYCTNKTFYSVTRINEVLAFVVTGVWVFLLMQYFFEEDIDCYAIVAVVLTVIVVLVLCFTRTDRGSYRTDIREGHSGEFIDRMSNRR